MKRNRFAIIILTLSMAMVLDPALSAFAADKKLSLFAKASVRYDTNVKLEPDDENKFSDEADSALVMTIAGTYRALTEKKRELDATFSQYQVLYRDLSEYQVTGSFFTLSGRYNFDRFTVGLYYEPAYYWADFSPYLLQNRLKAKLIYKPSQSLYGSFSTAYSDNNYKESNGRDGYTFSSDGIGYYYPTAKWGYLFAGLGYARNSATDRDFFYRNYDFKAGLEYKLPYDINLVSTFKYGRRYYDNRDSTYDVKREDEKRSLDLTFHRRWFHDWLVFSLNYNHTRNNSNIDDYEYAKHSIGLSTTIIY